MMQISTSTLYAIPRNSVIELQNKISKAETEVSTGELANPAESLGSQLGLNETLQAQSANLAAFQSSNTITSSKLEASQNALKQIYSDANTFVSAIVTAQNAGDVSTLASQAKSFLSSLTSLMNTTAGGVYVFGGTNSTVKPVPDYSTKAEAATAAAFQSAFGFSQSSSDVVNISSADMQAFLNGSFSDLFSDASWSSNWSNASSTRTTALIDPTQTVTTSVTANETGFKTLAAAYASIADLGIDTMNATTVQTVLSSALEWVGSSRADISNYETTLGISQSQIKNANSRMATQQTLTDNWVAKQGGVDPYQAASNLTILANQLETAYSLTSRIAKLGLVNYLG